ncbi:class I SAM-dependent methyltransferase [Cellulomonas sp. ICMP 17802]|uniref:class I SAM-dependent methyltransferase n=1 Tax=Cellulomonas sp. ICMP 17802 TaxID=3239199 RepID=UPI00351ABED4
MGFDVAADAYGRFMGRYSEPLAERFAAALGVSPGARALDVGCGPGALTAQLVARLGADAVAAVDPSESFVAAARARFPGLRVDAAGAESLPFDDDAFDLTVAQLAVPFMSDPVAGLAEMARVTRPGGGVAASAWDHAGAGGPLRTFWRAVRDIDPAAPDESTLPGVREGHLAELFRGAGLEDVTAWSERVSAHYGAFDEWWQTYTLGVGPAGEHVAGLDDAGRDALRARCAELLPSAPFDVTAVAWCVRSRVQAGSVDAERRAR